MTTRYEQFPNDTTLVMFHVLSAWGWSIREIAEATDTPRGRVRDILADPILRRKGKLSS